MIPYKQSSTFFLLIFTATVAVLVPLSSSKDYGTISYGEEISGTVDPADPILDFWFTGQSQYNASITLDIESLDSALTMTLFGPDGNEIASNQSLNYPYFQGAYLFVDLAKSGTYTVHIEMPGITAPIPFKFIIEKQVNDEPDRLIQIEQAVSGNIADYNDQDVYAASLQAGTPVLISVITPKNILNADLWIFTPQGDIAAYSTDLYSSAPVLPFVPTESGTYYILVEGETYDAAGPYSLIIHAIPELQSPPIQISQSIQIPGDTIAYSIHMDPQKVYEFTVTGEDNFSPAIIVTDSAGIQAWNEADPDQNATTIPGFTPLSDEVHYVMVMGKNVRATGEITLNITSVADEADGSYLQIGDDKTITIGPIGDKDQYLFHAVTNQDYSFFFYRTFQGLDPQINIYNPSGTLVWQNDNAAVSDAALLSKIQFPEEGDYTVELLASDTQTEPAWLTGVGVIRVATGAPFDKAAPLVVPSNITITSDASGKQIILNTKTIVDDTYPVTGEIHAEPSGLKQDIILDPNGSSEIQFHLQPDEIAFADLYDSADSNNFTRTTAIPGPEIISTVSGTPFGLAIDESNQIFVTETTTGSIYKTIKNTTPELFIEGLDTNGGIFGPNALTFDSNGLLYCANAKTNTVLQILPSGESTAYASGLAYPSDIIFDKEGILYVSQLTPDTIDRIYPDGTKDTFVTGIRNPNGMAFSPDGTLYVCNNDRGNSGIYKIEPDGTPVPFLEEFTETLDSIVFDSDGYLYAADGYLGVIYRIDPNGEWLVFARGLSGPSDLAFGQGEDSKILFASNLGTVSSKPYISKIIAMPTGRIGFSIFTPGVTDWALW